MYSLLIYTNLYPMIGTLLTVQIVYGMNCDGYFTSLVRGPDNTVYRQKLHMRLLIFITLLTVKFKQTPNPNIFKIILHMLG